MQKPDFTSSFNIFISDLDSRLLKIDINLDVYIIDHACFRCANTSDYQAVKILLKEISRYQLIKMHHDREFNCFVLKEPLKYKEHEVLYIEISEPGGSDIYNTGFQHIEILTKFEFKDISNWNQAQKLLFKGAKGDEIYLKWPDRTVLKLTKKPFITKCLEEKQTKLIKF